MMGPSGLVHSETTFWLLDDDWHIRFTSEGAGLPLGLTQQQIEMRALPEVIGADVWTELRNTGTATLRMAGSDYTLTLHPLAARGIPLQIVRVQPADATLTHVVSFIVHELRNPLSAMRALVQGLEEELKDLPDTHPYTGRLIGEIDRLSRLLNSMAQLSRLRPHRAETFSLLPVAQRVVRLFERECAQRGVQIQLEVEGPLAEIEGDPDLFTQLFVNLVTNGLEAMPAGGLLRVALRGTGPGEVAIHVQDSGVGMTPDQLERVMHALYTSKPEGMGLGLYIVRDIVRRYQGKIHISSAPGHGTSVTIVFNQRATIGEPGRWAPRPARSMGDAAPEMRTGVERDGSA